MEGELAGSLGLACAASEQLLDGVPREMGKLALGSCAGDDVASHDGLVPSAVREAEPLSAATDRVPLVVVLLDRRPIEG